MSRVLVEVVVFAACAGNDDIKPPRIASITPDHAKPGASVVIAGNYFCSQPEADDPDELDPFDCDHVGAVSFGFALANVTLYSDVMIVTEVPDLAPGTADVRVATNSRSSNGFDFVVE